MVVNAAYGSSLIFEASILSTSPRGKEMHSTSS